MILSDNKSLSLLKINAESRCVRIPIQILTETIKQCNCVCCCFVEVVQSLRPYINLLMPSFDLAFYHLCHSIHSLVATAALTLFFAG